jgi:ABC-type multidrug transport system fused ATPase/permease subunit
MVAIVGPNGSGKTTIVNLILGFYRPQKGTLCADGHLFSDLDIVHLRRHIGVVTQDAILFSGTILDNITYGYPDASREQVTQAARLATADEFIQQLARGYETLVGENGLLLSGGQRQRIAIARALLRQPRLLILDEPTNHLDTAAARRLMENLRSLPHKPACLMISHDVETVRKAQFVHFLQQGRIVATERQATLSSCEAVR